MSLAQRSITSVSWNAGTNLVKIAILLARSILLARLLPVEVFGIYALATSLVTFSSILPMWGMGGAFLHRAPETADEEQAAAVHFTLRLVLLSIWTLALLGAAHLLTSGSLQTALFVLTPAFAALHLSDTPRFILTRRVVHRRLAVLDLLTAVITTIIAVYLAWRGYGLSALLATDVATAVLAGLALYVWRPVWRPRLVWLRDTVRYYLHFGSRTMAESALSEAIDNLDDIWTGAYLGHNALGLYSRAYTFATYPRRILAFPVNLVAGGTYAELKEARHQLSQAFFRTNALLVRSGFLFGGLMVLLAPEFVRLALGEKWLPMIPTFRLMAVFTLLDPVRVTVSQIFVAAGRPERVVRIRLIQLATLIIGLFLFGRIWGIIGVALVVNGVLLLGLIPLIQAAREHVDFSASRLFAGPITALIAGASAALAIMWLMCRAGSCPNDWITGIAKGLTFAAVFGGVLLAIERDDITRMIADARNLGRDQE